MPIEKMKMLPQVTEAAEVTERYTEERCFIRELSNSDSNEELSIALARVEPGITTAWHKLEKTHERYLIIDGEALVELEAGPTNLAKQVTRGDLIEIPEGCRQRIRNTGDKDLLFYAVCTPRFVPSAYISDE